MTDPDWNTIWRQVLGELQLQMDRNNFNTWLSGARVLAYDDQELIVGVRHQYAVDWIAARLMPAIRGSLERRAGRPVRVSFVVAGPGAAQEEPGTPAEGQREPGEILVEAVREERVTIQPGGSLVWTDFYIKLKVAFRRKALRDLKGPKLSIFLCLALHVDRDGVAYPGIQTLMKETGYSRSVVCSALDDLVRLGLISKRATYRGCDEYIVNGYAWFGQTPVPALWEEQES